MSVNRGFSHTTPLTVTLSSGFEVCSVQVLMDLSVAFDTTDFNIFLDSMKNRGGISGPALNWCESYPQDKDYFMLINTYRSVRSKMICGVPQGSVVGSVHFNSYM